MRHLTQLDRLGIIELKPLNRYRLKVAKTFRWRANGPVMQFFRDHGVADYFSGGFDGESEMVSLVHGHISLPMAKVFQERLQRRRAGLRPAAPGRPAAGGGAQARLHRGDGAAVVDVRASARAAARSEHRALTPRSADVGGRRRAFAGDHLLGELDEGDGAT